MQQGGDEGNAGDRTAPVRLSAPEITHVRPPGKIEFSYHCSWCGQIENRIELSEVVDRAHFKALMELAIDAHLRKH